MATRCCSFELQATLDGARAGVLHTPHGPVPTPAFMPVGTRGSVRGVDPVELRSVGSHIVLANTMHLWERPGHARIQAQGGLARFMGWNGPMLTDSGGYQVFSLSKHVKLTEEGVRFRSPTDGNYRMLTPELAVEIQEALGVDVAMALDECIPKDADRAAVSASTDRTTRWLARCLAARRQPEQTALFGIVQGGMFPDLRAAHARVLLDMDLDGYAIGGLSVGEGHARMLEMVEVTTPVLPQDRPRYLMGVGHPGDIAEAVARGCDLFDCVLPTRAGRHGQAYTSEGRINLRNATLADDGRPLDPGSPGSPGNAYSRAYLRHLFTVEELLGARVATLHNLWVYQDLMARMRAAILAGDAAALAAARARAAALSVPPSGQGGAAAKPHADALPDRAP
jgi:queuine tRNA-ribosyltransferase